MPLEIPDAIRELRAHAAPLLSSRDDLVAAPLDRAGRGRLVDLDASLIDLISRLRVDPCDGSAEVPLVLLPVRVQAKLAGQTLRVRITPDEVHIDGLDRTLSDSEQAAARAYWHATWPDEPAPAAWVELVEAVGADRAGWVARAMTPANLDERPAGEPAFPEPPAEVSPGTVVRCLPDRFTVSVQVPGHDPIVRTGGPVPRDLRISPIALDDDDVAEVQGLRVPVGAEWTVSFDAAQQVGLGIEVPLPGGIRTIESIVVAGTRQSVPEQDAARELADLLVSHAYTDGFGALAHGVPTNNADAARSPYQPTATAGPPAAAAVTASEEATGIARLLGVDADEIEALLPPGSPRSTLGAAQRAANTALWWVTWEPVLRRIDSDADVPAVTPSSIESARRVHRDDVRGAGHSSAIRVGAQPYGILPVTDLGAFVPRSGEITAALVPLVRRILTRWTTRADTLPRVRPNDDVSDAAMLEMLGLSPVATGVRVRPGVDGKDAGWIGAGAGIDKTVMDAQWQLTKAVLSQYSLSLAQRLLGPALDDTSRRVALPLVSERDPEVIAEILADRTPQVDSVLQALLDLAWDEAKTAHLRAAPEAYLPPLIETLGIDDRVARMATAAVSGVAIGAAVDASPALSPGEYFEAAATIRSTVRFEGQPVEALSLSAIEPVAEARTSLAQVALDLGDTDKAKWVGQEAVASLLNLFGMRWEAMEAMQALAAVPLDERRVAVASAIDVASHRADAWATGIASARHRRLASGEGITIGAFGYVEDIRLGAAGAEPGGWLHAPSPSHAVAEGILASAHRSRIGAKADAEPFAIDLSSRRGRELRRVLEGVRRGQPIGALLGYQIERGLTGSAARFQLTLRQLAPMNTDQLDNDAASADRTARMAAADVTDGVELLRRFPVAGLDGPAPALRTALDTPPVNAYVEPGTWEAVTDAEWGAVRAALRAASDTLDAVSDALVSESVLQYVSGNAARASAAMDAAGSGAAVDPELAVLGVRQAGRVLTHNAYAVVADGAAGWSGIRPRALAEPRLEAWAARRLGDPATVVLGDAGAGLATLADAGFAALDLVFADDLDALVRELRVALPGLGEIAHEPDAAWPAGSRTLVDVTTLAGSLRAIAAGATALTPDRLVPAGKDPQHAIDLADLDARCEALRAALDAAVQQGAATIAAIDPVQRTIDEAGVAAVAAAVAPLAAFGIPLTPDPALPVDAGWAVSAWHTAAARLEAATALQGDLRSPRPPGEELTVDQVVQRAGEIVASLLGDGFPILPVLRRIAGTPDDFAGAVHEPRFTAPPAARLSAFVRDHATVRTGMAKLAEAQLLGRALGTPVALRAVQLTHTDAAGTPDPGTDHWLAGELPDDRPWPSEPAIHVVLELVGTLGQSSDAVAGILFDNWAETLPFQPDARAFDERAVDTPVRAARATTGLAIHANQASARAPQVILSAVSADGSRWTTASVVQAVRSAVALSKARLVTYETLPGDGAVLPAAYVASPWLQARKSLFFADLAQISWAKVPYPFLSEVK